MHAAFALLFAATLQEIPDHPDKLKFPDARFDVPDPDAMRAALPCGAVVYALEDDALPLVQLQIYVRSAGSFSDAKGKEGLAELFGAVLRTGGTKKRAPQDLEEELDFLAASLDVNVSEVYATASLSLLAKDLDRGLEILADVLRNPEFRQEKLDLARDQTLFRLKGRNDSPASIESREANRLLYGDDFPLNRLPTRVSVESVKREDLVDLHRACFQASNIVVAAAGAFKKKDLLDKLQAAFDGWTSDRKPPAVAIGAPASAAPAVYGFSKPIPQGRVTIGHLGIDIRDPDLHAIRVMNYILGGGGFSSRLMQRVRTDEGLVYDVSSEFQPRFQFPGTFRITFQSKNASCAFAVQLCLEELKRLQTEKPGAEELDAAKRFYLDGFPDFFFSTRFSTVRTFAAADVNGYPKDYYQSYRPRIAAVTADDVLRVARDRIHPDRFVIVAVGDLGLMAPGDGKHPAALKDFGPVKLVPLPDPETLERTQ